MKDDIINELKLIFQNDPDVTCVYAFGSLGKEGHFDKASDIDLYIQGNISLKNYSTYLNSLLAYPVDLISDENLQQREYLIWNLICTGVCLKGDSLPLSILNYSVKNFSSATTQRLKKVVYSIRTEDADINNYPSSNHPLFGYLIPTQDGRYSLRYIEKLISYYSFLKLQEDVYSPYSPIPKHWRSDYLNFLKNDDFYDDICFWDLFLKENGRVIDINDKTLFFTLLKRLKNILSLEIKLVSFN